MTPLRAPSIRGIDISDEGWDARDVAAAFERSTAGDASVDAFVVAFATLAGVTGDAHVMPSGREALRQALMAPGRKGGDEVAAPSFCCPDVGHAIIAAGLRVRLLDSAGEPGRVDRDQLLASAADDNVCAVVLPHLFGAPLPTAEIADACRANGVRFIEDCAQSIGMRNEEGTMIGTSAEFAVYSFGREKPVSLLGGGLLVANDRRAEIDDRLRAVALQLGASARDDVHEHRELEGDASRLASLRAEIGADRTFSARARGAARRFLTTGRARRSVGTVMRSPGRVRAALGTTLVELYATTAATRAANHARLAELLEGTGVGTMMRGHPPAGFDPQFAVLLARSAAADRIPGLHGALWKEGIIGARLHVPQTMDGDPQISARARAQGSLERAHDIGRRRVDLPIHAAMSHDDIERVARTVIRVLA